MDEITEQVLAVKRSEIETEIRMRYQSYGIEIPEELLQMMVETTLARNRVVN